MNIRKAVSKDVRALAELESKWETSPGWGEKGILAEIENPVSELLVFEENRILGFVGCRFLPPEAQITTIVVSPQHTGKGIARALLVRLLSESSLRGCACAVLEVDETNAPAIMLYKGMGFEIVGRRPKFYNGLRDAILMKARTRCLSSSELRHLNLLKKKTPSERFLLMTQLIGAQIEAMKAGIRHRKPGVKGEELEECLKAGITKIYSLKR